MTPEQALDLLSQMVAQVQATLRDHQLAQQALQVLAQAIKGDEPEK